MVQVFLTEEQVRLLRHSLTEAVQLCDAQGKVVRTLEPAITEEEIAEAKRRAASKGPWFTSAQVQARLRALQEEWDRTGGFDEAYMREFLRKLDDSDPGHMRSAG